jgi:hypothetical protein
MFNLKLLGNEAFIFTLILIVFFTIILKTLTGHKGPTELSFYFRKIMQEKNIFPF